MFKDDADPRFLCDLIQDLDGFLLREIESKFPGGSVNIRIGTWVNGELSYAEAIAEGAPAEMSNSCMGPAETPKKRPDRIPICAVGENEDGIITAENAEIGQKRQYVLKRQVDSGAVGLSWAKRALANAPSVVEELYPEIARFQRQRQERSRPSFDCAEIPNVDEPTPTACRNIAI